MLDAIEALWRDVTWTTPRATSDAAIWSAIQACHQLHREKTAAYRSRCEREQIGEELARAELDKVGFPEEIWKGYSEHVLPDGSKLGVFPERDVPSLLAYLNQYLARPLTMQGLRRSYVFLTNVRGGLDRLRGDLLRAQGVYLMTSSGTTGSAISLIPDDPESAAIRKRANRMTFDRLSDLPGHGPIDPGRDFLVAFAPRDGSMLLARGMLSYAEAFDASRAHLTIPARVYTQALRWRGGAFYGWTGRILSLVLRPLLRWGGKATSRKAIRLTLEALRAAAASGRRTLFMANQWMFHAALGELARQLETERRAGRIGQGEPLVTLPPGSLMLSGGGNKSGIKVAEEEIDAGVRRVIGGIDVFVDGYGKAEALGGTYRCPEKSYHFDPHVMPTLVDGYLAWFDPREVNKVPMQITGDRVDALHEESCPCGVTTRFFRSIERDSVNRGSKGCAAALAEYAS